MMDASMTVTSPAPARRVLVVDGEPGIQRLFRLALRNHGFQTVAVSSGSDGIEALRAGTFDVIVSDVNMADDDGLTFLRDLRAIDENVPVILLTGAPTADVAKRAAELGVFRYLSKPVSPAALRELVEGAASLHDALGGPTIFVEPIPPPDVRFVTSR